MKRLLMSIIVFLIILCAGTGCYEQSGEIFSTGDTSTLPIQTEMTGGYEQSEETDNLSTVSTLPIQIETNSGTEGGENMNKNCRLLVNGKDISSENYVFLNHDDGYADLPLTAIAEALGASVEWKDETTATIAHKGKQYILDTEQYFLREKNENSVEDFLLIPPGAVNVVRGRIIGDDFVISNVVIRRFITRLGAKISIDYDASIVYIDTID